MKENNTIIKANENNENILCNRPYEVNEDGVIVVEREINEAESLPKNIFRTPRVK